MARLPRMVKDEGYDYGEVVVLQHVEDCGPGGLAEILDGRSGRRPWHLADLGAGDPVPQLNGSVRGLILLGGRMGVADIDAFPWMRPEVELIRDAADAGVPVLGICLGAQLLAHALGGEVAPRDVPEIGFPPLSATEEGRDDPVFAGWPDGAAVTMIHDDEVVRLPDGAVPMAATPDGVGAWRASDGLSYGVQFHPEVTLEQFTAWCRLPGSRERFDRAGTDPDAVAEEAQRRAPFVRAAALGMLGRFVDQVVGRDDPRR